MTLSTSTVTLAPGSSRTYSLAPGEAVTVATEPNCYVTVTETPDVISSADLDGQTNVRESILQYKGSWTYGPYALGGTVTVAVSLAKSTSSVSVTLGSSAAAVVGAGAVGVLSNGSEFSLDSVFPRTDTEFPAERVRLSASGCACAAPCQIERIRCVTGTSVALVVYDNPAVSSGTQLYSGTLSAGEEALIAAPIRAINSARAVFASGSFDFYISQEI